MRPCKLGGRSLYREHGLKFVNRVTEKVTELSLPLPGAWIEIPRYANLIVVKLSLPLPGAWIEIFQAA